MNSDAHAEIMTGAYQALSATLRNELRADPELLRHAGNYPDYFDDPTRPEEKKAAIDPDWRTYCVYPEGMAAHALHFWPGHLTDQSRRIPLLSYLLDKMIDCRRAGNHSGFIKFSGCISHYFGDVTQPAHLNPESEPNFIGELLPHPDHPDFGDFHYHTTIEAVTGRCGKLAAPEIQGTCTPEAAWRLARRSRQAISYCRRFIVPIAQALFNRDQAAAVKAASEPVTIAAQLTADAMITADAIARNCFDRAASEALAVVDLRLLPPDREFHDLVYFSAVLDGNKDVPPNNVPITPARLRYVSGIKEVKGLGMLPHSGMNGPRECYMTWKIPAGVFRRFSAQVGLHAELATTGAVSFQVLLDGREKWNSGRMIAIDLARKIDLPIDLATEITLKVCDANNGKSFWKNHAFWAEPLLNKI